MPNVMGREFPYTPQGMAQAEQYRQAVGMRGGGMMGFRPVGYAEGDLVEDMPSSQPKMDKATLIEIIMDLTGMEDPSSLLDMSYEQLLSAQQNLMANAPQAARGYSIPQGEGFGTTETVGAAGRMVLPSSLVATGMGSRVARQALENARMTDPAYAMAVEEDFNTTDPSAPNPFMPVGMKRGGIMSLRGY